MIAASIDYLDDAVELVLTAHTPARLVVFDYRPEVDDQREAFEAAKARLAQAGSPVIVETLADVLDRGRALPAAPVFVSRRGRPVDAADLHLRQHRRTEGRHATRAPGRQLLAQIERSWGQQHSAEPWITLSFMPMSHLMGRGSPVRDARQWRHGLFRSQERSLDFPGRPRAGAAHPAGLRAADLGHAVRRVPERTGPAVVRSAPIARHWKRGDGRAAAEPARWTVRRGDDGLRADLGRDEGVRRVLPRSAPGGRLRLDRGRARLPSTARCDAHR